jgi:DNA mismatch repair protein MutL
VRFLDGGAIYRSMLQTIRNKFLSTDLTARVDSPNRSNTAFEETSSPAELQPLNSIAAQSLPFTQDRFLDHQDRLVQWARGAGEDAFTPRPQLSQTTNQLPAAVPQFRPFPGAAVSTAVEQVREMQETAKPDFSQYPEFAPPAMRVTPSMRVDDSHTGTGSYLGYQIHNRYLITQDDSGMVVIDQHALHERILYEQIREKVLAQTLETQRLLIPEPVTLTAAEAALALDHQATLEKLGISIEPFGGDCILITSYPAMLANINPGDVLRQVVEKLQSDGATPQSRDLIDSLLHLIACKAAIKAGDRLTPDEITSLLEQRFAYQDTHHCPHGRPTALHFSRQELDKMFKRI